MMGSKKSVFLLFGVLIAVLPNCFFFKPILGQCGLDFLPRAHELIHIMVSLSKIIVGGNNVRWCKYLVKLLLVFHTLWLD